MIKMKPFIVNFAEKQGKMNNSNFTEYSHSLNLNVIKGSTMPAICGQLAIEGQTSTKEMIESTDCSEIITYNAIIGGTQTRQSQESTDIQNIIF
ncbi:MAG: hypothetical protein H6Q15_2464 [Bacteroidetes bacterium]|nr:hypothetical protein [Bacteroidota bacterium]